MRTVPFKEVLWSVARKAGYSPESGNFISNQAIAIGEYINDWVSRLYTQEDWPEWTKVLQIDPDVNHIVPYEGGSVAPNAARSPFNIARTLTVYLVDPKTTRAPITTRFSLREEGIHCGYEHGTSVWIKYLEPPPKFTANPWRPEITYGKNDVVYSGMTGECYKSKANGNIGHNPTMSFQEPTRSQPITTEITQDHIPANVGLAGRPEILVIDFATVTPDPPPPDVPEADTSFYIDIYDVATEALLGDDLHTADGVETLADVITAMAAALDAALPASFIVTANTTLKTITFQDESQFISGHSSYITLLGIDHLFKVTETQSYIPPVVGTPGQPQLTKVTFTTADVETGTTYTIVFTDDFGISHTVEYTAADVDSGGQIIMELMLAIEAARATDPYFESVSLGVDPTALTLTIGTQDASSIDVTRRPPPPRGSPWWDLVRFPEALVNPVVRGAGAALMGEWDQTDKGTLEEQKVSMESNASRGDFETTPVPPLTTQQKALSRYKS